MDLGLADGNLGRDEQFFSEMSALIPKLNLEAVRFA